MKVKVTSLEGIPKELQSEYEPQADGTFQLKLEGDVTPRGQYDELAGRLNEFRTNNVALIKEKALLEAKLKGFDGLDPAEYATLKTKIKELEEKGGIKNAGDVDARVRAAVAEAVNPLKEQLEAERKARQEAGERLAFRDLESKFTQVAIKAGVDEKALPDFLNRALEVFDLDGVAREGEKELFSKKDVTKPLSPEEFAENLALEAPHLFKGTSGAGARPGSNAGKRVINGTDPVEFGRNLKDIASGAVVVSR